MRNTNRWLASGLILIGLAGCMTQPSAQLLKAQSQMQAHDYDGVQKSADAMIAQSPRGPEAAQAYYLKGRAVEELSSDTAADARERLQQARTDYIAALKAGGEHGPLEGYIRASLSNVSYWQEDYTTAAQQGLAAGPLLTDPTMGAWTTYRAGLSQQRLGEFIAADATFVQAIARAPGSDPAVRAQAHRGTRAFQIRILIDRLPDAQARAQMIGKNGMKVSIHPKTDGAAAELLVGAFPTYAAALKQRAAMLGTFPNAVVIP